MLPAVTNTDRIRTSVPVSSDAGATLCLVQNFRAQYERHLDLLCSHCEAYDEGREHFAYEIATKIRVFVHDTRDRRGRPQSTALLTHLGVKQHLGYIDWGPAETPRNVIAVGSASATCR